MKNLMTVSEIKIKRLQPENSRNIFERIQKMKKSRAIVFDFPFSFRYIFASFCSRTILNTALESSVADPDPKDPNHFAGSGSESKFEKAKLQMAKE